jgi:polysaccharide export outer membrane protein
MLACLISGLIAIVALGACATSGNAPIEAVNSAGTEMVRLSQTQEQPQYRFYPGDELSVTAVNRPELTVGLVRVDPYGYISYPYLGQVNVKDLTSQEVAERLTRGLQDGDYYKRVALRVSFVGAKEQYVYVLGEVRTPGPIPITGGIPLLEAIGKAGGKTYDAEMSTVLWIRGRQSPPAVVKLDLNALGDPRSSDPKILNFTLIPGDVIYIPDSVIVSVQRFFNRMYDILRPIVLLESGIVLYDSVERVLTGRYYANKPGGGGTTTIIVTPTTR